MDRHILNFEFTSASLVGVRRFPIERSDTHPLRSLRHIEALELVASTTDGDIKNDVGLVVGQLDGCPIGRVNRDK